MEGLVDIRAFMSILEFIVVKELGIMHLMLDLNLIKKISCGNTCIGEDSRFTYANWGNHL
jgi:hypothetical protein